MPAPGTSREGREQPEPFMYAREGFTFSATVACRADDRRKPERLCRFVVRPAIALERLRRECDGLTASAAGHRKPLCRKTLQCHGNGTRTGA